MPPSPTRLGLTSQLAARLLRRAARQPRPGGVPRPPVRSPQRALAQCAHTTAALSLLADLTDASPAALRSALTPRELEQEPGRALATLARTVAARHLADETDPPVGPAMFTRVVRALHAASKQAQDDRQNAEADRALSSL